MTNNQYERGSQWRKWDLHLHTPSSYDYKNNSVENESIVNKLVENEIALAVLTDHHYIDVDRFFDLKNIAKDKVKFLPGIELRTELGGKESVHITAIFQDYEQKCQLENLWNTLKVKLNISELKVNESGNDSIYVNFENACKEIKDLNGLIAIHAGKKSNSLENISNALSYKQAIKTNIAQSVDLYEIGNENDILTYNEKVFPDIKRIIPLIKGSDNHNIFEYNIELPCWIKADVTFAGLKQALVEVEDRIYLGNKPDKIKQIEINKTKYIDKISFCTEEPSMAWIKQDLLLNPELVSIIGNKGSGKSACADIIGLLGNSKNYKYFSFLNNEKFFKDNSADMHFAKIKWISDEDFSKIINLKTENQNGEIEKVKYIPQSYFERVCNLIDNQKDLKKEIENVIFEHLDSSIKENHENFDNLIESKKDKCIKNIETNVNQLKNEINEYVSLSNKLLTENLDLNKSYFAELSNQKMAIEANLGALEKNKVQKPSDQNNITNEIEKLDKNITNSIQQNNELKNKSLILSKQIQELCDIKSSIESFKNSYDNLSLELFEKLNIFDLSINEIITFNYNIERVSEKEQELILLKNNVEQEIQKCQIEIENLIKQKSDREKLLSGEEKKYQDYINNKSLYQQKLETLLGDETKIGTYSYYYRLCSEDYIQNLKSQKENVLLRIQNLTENIFESYVDVRKIYEKLKENVDKFIKDFNFRPNSNINIEFKPKIKIKNDEFKNNIMSFLNKVGTFRGEDRDEFFNKLFNKDLNAKEDFLFFIKILIDEIKNSSNIVDDTISIALKKGMSQESLYEYIYSANYLDVDYDLEFNNKPISMLSPGERGLLLLTFYLLADTSNSPLILDQPEENLDNQTIYNVLVQLIKNAKRKRQVIIVTHNPNLAVVCDSEQIVCANFDVSKEPKITYISGSIENPNINAKIVDILEGTMPAFKNREDKYL